MNRCEAYRGVVGAAAAVVALAVGVQAHDAHVAGPYRLVIGWSDEPALAGIRNAVAVEITETGKGAVLEGSAALSVEISFGNERVVLPLRADSERKNVFEAWIVPTRAGSYTFHITGTVNSRPIDITTACSDQTFDCVVDGSAIQFPVKDPSPGQVAERLERSLPRAEQAVTSASRAQAIAFVALGIAMIAATMAGVRLRRAR